MQPTTNVAELADELAEIARTARDAATGDRLLRVVDRLLREAGLPVVTGATLSRHARGPAASGRKRAA